MNQQKLSFDSPAPAAHDSKTSSAAAVAVTKSGRHASIQERVLEVLRLHPNGLTDEEIAVYVTGCRYTSIVSARNSLCNEIWDDRPPRKLIRPALVEHSGRTKKSPTTGMPVTIWRIK